MIVERTEAAKRPNVPNYVTESSYTEDIPARIFVGDAQDKRTLAILNLETGKSVPAIPSSPQNANCGGRCDRVRRRLARRGECAATQQGPLARGRRSRDGQDAGRRCAARRCVGARNRRVLGRRALRIRMAGRSEARVVLSERDGWMHLYSVDASASNATRDS